MDLHSVQSGVLSCAMDIDWYGMNLGGYEPIDTSNVSDVFAESNTSSDETTEYDDVFSIGGLLQHCFANDEHNDELEISATIRGDTAIITLPYTGFDYGNDNKALDAIESVYSHEPFPQNIVIECAGTERFTGMVLMGLKRLAERAEEQDAKKLIIAGANDEIQLQIHNEEFASLVLFSPI